MSIYSIKKKSSSISDFDNMSIKILSEVAYNDTMVYNTIYTLSESRSILNEGILSTIWDTIKKFIKKIREKIVAIYTWISEKIFRKKTKSNNTEEDDDDDNESNSSGGSSSGGSSSGRGSGSSSSSSSSGPADDEFNGESMDEWLKKRKETSKEWASLTINVNKIISDIQSITSGFKGEEDLADDIDQLKNNTMLPYIVIQSGDKKSLGNDFSSAKIADADTLSKLRDLKSKYTEIEIDALEFKKFEGAYHNTYNETKIKDEKKKTEKVLDESEKAVDKKKNEAIQLAKSKGNSGDIEKRINANAKAAQAIITIFSNFTIALFAGMGGAAQAEYAEHNRMIAWRNNLILKYKEF